MGNKEILEYVRDFADKSHGHQVRKFTGERYIQHPVRVMEMLRQYDYPIEVLSAALLHDVLEDTPVTPSEMEMSLRQVFHGNKVEAIMRLVIDLTDVYVKKNYPRLNRRSRKEKEAARLSLASPEAQSIKYADIIDNVTDIVAQDSDFAKVFVREAKQLLSVMRKGHPQLRDRAVAAVERCLQDLPAS